jgi:GTPase SAR1 family protein
MDEKMIRRFPENPAKCHAVNLADEYFQTRAQLGTALFALNTLAHDLKAPAETIRTLGELGTSLREPFLFVVVGEVKAGKSSLLNAIFGRDFCRVDVLPVTDKVYLFKHGEEERDVPVSAQLVECHRSAEILNDFNIVDTPGTNTIVAEHETITRQFLPLADLCIVVFSTANPWGASAWQFLQHIHRKWLKKVVFVLQQIDLRTPAEVAKIVEHMEQTMLQKIGERCPLFPVSARCAWESKHETDPENRAALWAKSGFGALEGFINTSVSEGTARHDKLRSVCRSAQVILDEHGTQVRGAVQTLDRDLKKLEEIRGSLREREEQSVRQTGGLMWTIAQNYERTQRRGEDLLRQKLTFGKTLRLVFGGSGWEKSFQAELESKQRENATKAVADALELIEADLKSVWKQVHDLMQRHFSDQSALPALPDFSKQRKELLNKIELSLLERGDGEAFERQMQALFSETTNWLRIPAGVAAAGGIGVVAAALMKAAILDITMTVAGVGAAVGTIVAVAKRSKILNEYSRQMAERRETMLHSIDDHLRHAMKRFYQELEQIFAPLEAFCAAQKKILDPLIGRLRDLEDTLGRCGACLGA